MNVPLYAWLAVFGIIAVMLAVDLFAHRKAHVIGVREAAIWSVIWVLIGISFGVVIWVTAGAEFGQQYYAGYLIEKSLAVDNVFVWAIIFAAFAVPRQYQHRVLFLGVLGALVLRGIFIAAGAVLIENFSWILYVFAAFLIYTGYRMIRTRNEHVHPEKSQVLRLFRRFIPMTETFHGQRFLVRKNGILLATPLLAVLVLVEVTDVVFAVDSIPAIFAVTSEPFIVFTANAFAILGLRAMYFLLADLMHRFIYLKIGLSLAHRVDGQGVVQHHWLDVRQTQAPLVQHEFDEGLDRSLRRESQPLAAHLGDDLRDGLLGCGPRRDKVSVAAQLQVGARQDGIALEDVAEDEADKVGCVVVRREQDAWR